ncbi:Imm8 family immunity protein [Sphingopyxis sp. H115]|uniref:Imm8 family immunity protein n=1 Tax=Sphingopyxis sp. H115 TaxID=1759073 RepID=UPI0007367414|nr:Imm8 family immunity protein [Sphingopyxis sp. H115]KTE08596.1 hypothetical protein ATE71_14155 [Sphingopyxis sp. H115]
MEAELRSLATQDGEFLTDIRPAGDVFCIAVRAEIGSMGSIGADLLDFEVCSPSWLDSELDRHLVLPGGQRLFMRKFDPDAVEQYVRKRLRHATGAKWQEIAIKIGEWARWEFADYNG